MQSYSVSTHGTREEAFGTSQFLYKSSWDLHPLCLFEFTGWHFGRHSSWITQLGTQLECCTVCNINLRNSKLAIIFSSSSTLWLIFASRYVSKTHGGWSYWTGSEKETVSPMMWQRVLMNEDCKRPDFSKYPWSKAMLPCHHCCWFYAMEITVCILSPEGNSCNNDILL